MGAKEPHLLQWLISSGILNQFSACVSKHRPWRPLFNNCQVTSWSKPPAGDWFVILRSHMLQTQLWLAEWGRGGRSMNNDVLGSASSSSSQASLWRACVALLSFVFYAWQCSFNCLLVIDFVQVAACSLATAGVLKGCFTLPLFPPLLVTP